MTHFVPYLSVVATSRNDDHGGNALWRTQHFVRGLAFQAQAFQVPIELILVDWNPPTDRPSLAQALEIPRDNPYFQCRFIQVPASYHRQFRFSDKLPLFQYLAKNVGIYRAKGQYVLATNIDILFSDTLMAFLKKGLEPGNVYRVDRFDIEADIPDGLSFPKILKYTENHIIRVNTVRGTQDFQEFKAGVLKHALKTFCRSVRVLIGYGLKNFTYYITMPAFLRQRQQRRLGSPYKNLLSLLFNLKQIVFPSSLVLHTCACGDFTLMSKKDWEVLRGYPEWELYSWHIDSVLIYQAYHNGLKMVNLDSTHAIYHIEHGKGSGWTPEGANALFSRLDKNGISYLDDDDLEELHFQQFQNQKLGIRTVYNEAWGAPEQNFSEELV